MDPTERFIPADEVASQMGAGVDPANQALMQALSQIRQTQAQPLMTQDPLGQLGVALQGAYSASRGEQNPAVSQAMQMRQQQLGMAQQGFQNQMGMANMNISLKREQRLMQDKRTEMTLKVAHELLATDTPEAKTLGATYYSEGLKGLGIQVPRDVAKDIGQNPLKPAEIDAIRAKQIGGADDATLAALFKRPLATVQMIRQIPDTDLTRETLKLKSTAELNKQDVELTNATLETIKKQHEVFSPEMNQAVAAQGKVMNPVGGYLALSKTDQARAVQLALDQASITHNKGVDYTNNALYTKPLPPNQKAMYVDPRTGRGISGEVSQQSADVNGLVFIEDAATRRMLPAVRTLGETIQRVMGYHEERPNYWPPAMLGPDGKPLTMANAVAIRLGQAKMIANTGVDPVLSAIRASMADIVKLATTAGAGSRFSTFLAQLEKDSAGWDQPGTRESKFMQLNTSMNRLNDHMTALGLDPLPEVVTMPDGRRVIKQRGR